MKRALALAALLSIGGLAGCISGAQTTPAATTDGIDARLSQAVDAGLVAEHTPIASFDGTTLDAYVFRPDVAEAVPVIINFSPYWGNAAPHVETGGDAFSLYLIDYFVPRGYAVALVSARGTGLSDGCFTIGGPTEIADADAVATFLATQPWANGNVTATGKSYDGTIAQGLITTGNPHVRTIVPVAPISELYKYNYFAGVPYLVTGQAFNTYYVGMTSLAQQPEDPEDATWQRTPTRFCDESAFVQTNQLHSMATGDYTPYWQARNYSAMLPEALDTSVFYIHGLQDWNVKPDHMVPWIDELHERGVPVKMMLGQWAHDYPHRDDFNRTLLRWLDHELKGIDTGIMQEPMAQVQDTDDVWRHEDRWPATRSTSLVLYTSEDGTLSDTPGAGPSTYRDAPAADGVSFESAPLATALRLVGAPTFLAQVSATAARGTIAATLRLDGAPIGYCLLDLGHRDGMESTNPLVPGMVYDVTVPCYPQDVVLPKGSVLSFDVAHTLPGDARVSVVPIPTGAIVTIANGEGTRLELPVVPMGDVTVEVPQPVDVGCWAC